MTIYKNQKLSIGWRVTQEKDTFDLRVNSDPLSALSYLDFGFKLYNNEVAHCQAYIKVNDKISLFKSFLLKEHFEFLLLLVNLKPVHVIFTFTIREQVIIRAILAFRPHSSSLQLSLLQILVKRLVLSTLLRHRIKAQFQNVELLDRLIRDWRQRVTLVQSYE